VVFFSKSKNVVGLDIGSSAVKLVELKEKKGGAFSLVKLGLERLSPEAIVDGSIMDSSMVVETISKLNSEKAIKNSNYATSLSGHSVIIKKITLPAMSPEELSESIQWEAEQYIPFDINDVNLDYVPLTQPGSGDNIDVILVAVKKEKINDYTSVISQTGKVPVLVDVDAFAVQNAYETNYDVEDGKVLALVNIGASVTNVNVLSGGSSLFWRDITFGGNQYTDAIQRELSLSFDQAEELKRGHSVADYTIQQVIPILRRRASQDARLLHRDVGRRPRRRDRSRRRRLRGAQPRRHPAGQVRHPRVDHGPVPEDHGGRERVQSRGAG